MKDRDILCKQLSPCTFFPTCVCSRGYALPRHRGEPFVVSGDPGVGFGRLKALLAGLPHAVILTATDDYLYAACRNRLGFVDDLHCRLCSTGRMIHVRSASRLALWDFGANQRQVETLRRQLQSGQTGGGNA